MIRLLPKSKKFNRILIWFAAVISLPLLLSVTLQTPFGRQRVAAALSTMISRASGSQIRIEKIRGLIPFAVTIEKLTVKDSLGLWISAENIRLSWKPIQLIRRRFHFIAAGAQLVTVYRIPAEKRPAGVHTKKSFGMGINLPNLTIDTFYISKISVEQSAFGQYAELSASGSIQTGNPRSESHFSLTALRTDIRDTRLKLIAEYTPTDSTFSVEADFIENPAGIFSKVLKIEAGNRPVHFSLCGMGRLSSWKGKFAGSGWGFDEALCDISFCRNKTSSLGASGTVRMDTTGLAKSIPFYTGLPFHFSFFAHKSGEDISVDTLIVINPKASLSAIYAGSADLKTFNAHADVAFEDLGILKGTRKSPIKGAASFSISGKGDETTKIFSAVSRAENIYAGGFETSSASAAFTCNISGSGPDTRPKKSISITGKGFIKSPMINGDKLLGETDISWNTNFGSYSKDAWEIVSLVIRGLSASVLAKGNYNNGSSEWDMVLDCNADSLADFNKISGLCMAGSARSKISGKGSIVKKSLTATFSGGTNSIKGLPAGLDGVFGPDIDFEGGITIDSGQFVSLDRIRFSSESASFKAGVRMDINSKKLNGEWAADIPNIAAIPALNEKRIHGRLMASGDLKGFLSEPEMNVKISADNVLCRNIDIDNLRAGLSLQTRSGITKGDIGVTCTSNGPPLALSSSFVLDTALLSLPNLKAGCADNSLSGRIELDTKTMTSDGYLSGVLRDPSALLSFVNNTAADSVQFDSIIVAADLSPSDSGQGLDFEFKVFRISSPYGGAKKFILKGHYENTFSKPAGRAFFYADDYTLNELRFSSCTLSVNGDISDNTILFSGNGRLSDTPLAVSLKSITHSSPGTFEAILDNLRGQYGQTDLSLRSPARLTMEKSLTILDTFTIDCGRGSVSGGAILTDTSLNVLFSIDHMPATILRAGKYSPVNGNLNGSASVSGTPAAPVGAANITVETPGRQAEGGCCASPPFLLSVNAVMDTGTISVYASLTSGTDNRFILNTSLPCYLSFFPLSFKIPAEKRLKGNLNGTVDGRILQNILPSDDQVFSGGLSCSADLGGTVEAPSIRGFCTIQNGGYENSGLGILLRNIAAYCIIDQHQLTISRFKATDGKNGALDLSGQIYFDKKNSFPYRISAIFNSMTVLDDNDKQVVMNGRASLDGSFKQTSLSGDLSLFRAEYLLTPSRSIEEADFTVIELNSITAAKNTEPEQTPGQPFPFKLNLTLDMPGRLFVRGLGLESEWKGNISVYGTLDTPIVKGSVSIKRGSYDFLERRFDLSRGTITFNGESPVSPFLDIEAKHQSHNREIILRYAGPINSLPTASKITISSIPPASQEDLVAQLLFNRQVENITPYQAVRLWQTLNILSGNSNMMSFMERTQKKLPIDRIDLKEAEAGKSATALSVGKYLGEKVYIEGEKGLDPGSSGKVNVKWEVTPKIIIDGEVGTQSKGSIGINYENDY